MNIEPLTLSNKEVYVLTNIFDHETMIGIENPFENWSDDEIDKEVDKLKIQERLENEELFIIKEDEVLCSFQVIEYFSICLDTVFVIEVQMNKNKSMEKNVFYFSDEKVIHSTIIDVNGEKQCTFIECGKPKVAWQFIYQVMQSKNTPPPSNRIFKVPACAYKEDLLNQPQKQLLDVLEVHLNNEDAAQLAKILHECEELNTVQIHYRIKNLWHTDSIQFLYSQNQYWLIQKELGNEKKQTHIICQDVSSIIEEIKKSIPCKLARYSGKKSTLFCKLERILARYFNRNKA